MSEFILIKHVKRLFLATGVIAAAGACLVSCAPKTPATTNPANMPVPVNVYVAKPQEAIYYDQYPGNIVALSQVDIRPEVQGYVTGIFFKEGDFVKKGQKLYEIDKSKYAATYDQSLANLRVAESNLDQAKKDADRYIYLNEHDAVAKQVLDHALTALANAKSQVTAAKQDLVRSQTDLNYAIIKAPFDGTIGLSQVKLGTSVTLGQTVLNTISTDNPMAVDFVVNEKELPRFLQLNKLPPNPADSLFTIRLPDNSIYPQPGKIAVIDRGVDPQTGTIRVRTVFPNEQGMLRSGMSCIVRVHNQEKHPQIIIPSKAIVEQMGEYFVFITRDTTIAADNNAKGKKETGAPTGPAEIAAQKKVILGQTIGANVIVKEGLNEGDKVIIEGLQRLHDGSLITTASKPAGAKP